MPTPPKEPTQTLPTDAPVKHTVLSVEDQQKQMDGNLARAAGVMDLLKKRLKDDEKSSNVQDAQKMHVEITNEEKLIASLNQYKSGIPKNGTLHHEDADIKVADGTMTAASLATAKDLKGGDKAAYSYTQFKSTDNKEQTMVIAENRAEKVTVTLYDGNDKTKNGVFEIANKPLAKLINDANREMLEGKFTQEEAIKLEAAQKALTDAVKAAQPLGDHVQGSTAPQSVTLDDVKLQQVTKAYTDLAAEAHKKR